MGGRGRLLSHTSLVKSNSPVMKEFGGGQGLKELGSGRCTPVTWCGVERGS